MIDIKPIHSFVCSFEAERKIEVRSRGINTGCEENRVNLSPLRTYSEATYRRKRRLQDSQTSISQSPQSSQTSTAASEGNSPSKIGAKSEIIDLLEEISAEQLLIEPDEMCSAEDLDSLNHEPWLVEQSQNVQENEVSVKHFDKRGICVVMKEGGYVNSAFLGLFSMFAKPLQEA